MEEKKFYNLNHLNVAQTRLKRLQRIKSKAYDQKNATWTLKTRILVYSLL